MKPGTIVQLPDGRVGTVVFNGLCGVGIKWGRHDVTEADFEGTYGDLFDPSIDVWDWEWGPDAYLREPWPRADLECVGDDYEVLT